MKRLTPILILAVSALLSVAFFSLVSDSSDAETYTLTYNSNGAVSTTQKIAIVETTSSDNTYIVRAITATDWSWTKTDSTQPTKSFIGWSTDPYGLVEYTPGSSITISQDTVLYAIWSPFKIDVHQPIAYGKITISGSYSPLPNTTSYQAASGSELTFTFSPSAGTSYAVNYWVINGTEYRPEDRSNITVTVGTNVEVSVFIIGQNTNIYNLPDDFQAVEYIVNYNGAYIDTGYYPSHLTSIDLNYRTTGDWYDETAPMFGSRTDYRYNTYTFWEKSGSIQNNQMRSDYGSNGELVYLYALNSSYHITMGGGTTNYYVTYADKTTASKESTVAELDFHCPYSMYIFRIHGDSFSKLGTPTKLYSFTIYEGGKTVRNFVPCYYTGDASSLIDSKGRAVAPGTIGLYDTVYGLFYVTETGHLECGEDNYTIGFKIEGGTGGQDVITYSSLDDLASRGVTPATPIGAKVFLGYYLNGKTQVFDDTGAYVAGSLKGPGNYILGAAWGNVSVAYYKDVDGTHSKDDPLGTQTVDNDGTFTAFSAPTNPPENKSFLCWADSAGNSYYADTQGSGIFQDTDLYAVWIDTVHEFSVTYQYNDETGRALRIVIRDAESFTLIDGPSRSGCDFDSWNTQQDGKGDRYPAGSQYPIPESYEGGGVIFYAQWSYYIILDNSGGTGGHGSFTQVGTTLPQLSSLPTRKNLIFEGYFSSAGVMYFDSNGAPAQEWDLPTRSVLYAKWTGTVTISIGPSSSFGDDILGEGWNDIGSGKYTKQFTGYNTITAMLPRSIPVDDGEIFQGWNLNSTHYASGASFAITSNVSLSAKWVELHYTATFESNPS